MNKILDLQISYPDFQLNQIIDPDQVDLNNSQIVGKVNLIIEAINEFTQGTTGGANISITPLPEFPSATNVQQALNQIATYCKANNTTIQEILAKNTEQDNRLTTLESTTSNHGTRIGVLETDNASNKERLTTAESINTSQAQHLTTVDSRLTNIETKNTQQDNSITSINSKNDTQDRTLVSHEVVMDSHARRLSSVESVNTTQSNDITKIKGDIANINASNTNAEVVSARRTANGEQFTTIGKRMDYNEIGVGTALTTGQRGKMNMLLTSSNDTEFWEDSASLGSISDHNASPDAHTTLIANHELDTTSHQDIRDAIANIDVVTGWEDVKNKPSTFPPNTHTHDGSHITGNINVGTVKTSGDLTVGSGGINRLNFDTGRQNLSAIFWNASPSVDYGIVFKVDGQDSFYLYKDQAVINNPLLVDGVNVASEINNLNRIETSSDKNRYITPADLGYSQNSFSSTNFEANIQDLLAKLGANNTIAFYTFASSYPNLNSSIKAYLGTTTDGYTISIQTTSNDACANPIYIYPNNTTDIYTLNYDNILRNGGKLPTRSEIDSLKSSVSSGKTAVANAITAKGVATSNTAEFATMASNIGKIPTPVSVSTIANATYSSNGFNYSSNLPYTTQATIGVDQTTTTNATMFYCYGVTVSSTSGRFLISSSSGWSEYGVTTTFVSARIVYNPTNADITLHASTSGYIRVIIL